VACGNEFVHLKKAIEKGYLSEAQLDIALKRLFEARMKLGMFDPPSKVKYASIPVTDYDTEPHRALSLEVARQSIVLFKNENNTLPLGKKVKNILVLGPYASDTAVLLGNYNGTPSKPVTFLQGIKNRAGKNVKVQYCQGIEKPEVLAFQKEKGINAPTAALADEALAMAKKADVVIFAGGISPQLEGEEMDVKVEGFMGGDRTTLNMPAGQEELLAKLKATGKPVILVITNGSALAVNWAQENLPAIVEAWYPGEEGGNAVADVLFGNYNPAGRLPVTFYKSVNDIPAFDDYSMQGRTYKYFAGKPLYAFGYGLSYSKFSYLDASVPTTAVSVKDMIPVKVSVRNDGTMDGDEVVQVYVKQPSGIEMQPIKALVGIKREFIKAGETKEVIFNIPVSELRHYEPAVLDYAVAKGTYTLLIGSASDDIRLTKQLIIK
jgi:beta-glucosidase